MSPGQKMHAGQSAFFRQQFPYGGRSARQARARPSPVLGQIPLFYHLFSRPSLIPVFVPRPQSTPCGRFFDLVRIGTRSCWLSLTCRSPGEHLRDCDRGSKSLHSSTCPSTHFLSDSDGGPSASPNV